MSTIDGHTTGETAEEMRIRLGREPVAPLSQEPPEPPVTYERSEAAQKVVARVRKK